MRASERAVRIYYGWSGNQSRVQFVECGVQTALQLPDIRMNSLSINGSMGRRSRAILVRAVELNRLTDVTDLKIDSCCIEHDTDSVFSGMSKLSTISVRNCNVDRLPILSSISRLKSLKRVYLQTICGISRTD